MTRTSPARLEAMLERIAEEEDPGAGAAPIWAAMRARARHTLVAVAIGIGRFSERRLTLWTLSRSRYPEIARLAELEIQRRTELEA